MSIESTRAVIEAYLSGEHDTELLADDVVFKMMATGEANRGPEAVREALQYFYQVAFKAGWETRNIMYGVNQAVLEADFVGEHTGEFAGIPATGLQVKVPMCIVYDVSNGRIQEARIYFETPMLIAQISAGDAARAR